MVQTSTLGNRLRVMPLCDRSPGGIRIHTVTILSRLSPAYWTMGPYLIYHEAESTTPFLSHYILIIPQISHFVNL